ncbi:PREDICTED: uncharacterized protein LOC106897465 [Calidris pugnax]|uniref:uncharacterized protein LOC106897465 n=1 Tax=Calidris pugnax TaxID=198806 RepID=UPI00071C8FCB|nr:PREDICTED: uncharacterized protein LOC106897465 [Calidris pugnax]
MATKTEWSCPICCDTEDGIAHVTPCHHHFCLGCIMRWAARTSNCPLCRGPMDEVRFSVRGENDYLQCVVSSEVSPQDNSQADRAPDDLANSSLHHAAPSPPSSPQETAYQEEQGAAGTEARDIMSGLQPAVWAELFRQDKRLLNPVLPWLRQRLEAIFGEQWWLATGIEALLLQALCFCGLDEEAMLEQLQPGLQEHTASLVHDLIDVVMHRCSDEALRMLQSFSASQEEEDDGHAANSDSTTSTIENLTKTVSEQNKIQTEKIENIAKTQKETMENMSKTQNKTMTETIEKMTKVADRVRQYEDSLSHPIGVAAIENLTKTVSEQNKIQTEKIENIAKTQKETMENMSKTQNKTMTETIEKMTKAIVQQNETILHKLLEKLSEIGKESYSSPAQTQVAAQAQIPDQTQVQAQIPAQAPVAAQAQLPDQTQGAARTKVTAIKKKYRPMRPTKGKQDSLRGFLWLCLCNYGENMRRWDKKPTSALQARVLELQAAECRPQFAFTWRGVQYTWNRLPQGWKHSPTICHGLIQTALEKGGAPEHLQYIDDIIVWGNTAKEVFQKGKKIIEILLEAGFAVKRGKVKGPAQDIQFLGIEWQDGRRQIPMDVINKITAMSPPTNKNETQAFLGVVGFWRMHIPGYSQIVKPLYEVTRKKNEFTWGPEQRQAFEQIKQEIVRAVALGPVRRGQDIKNVLYTAAGDNGPTWSLWQKGPGETRGRPLGFWSQLNGKMAVARFQWM